MAARGEAAVVVSTAREFAEGCGAARVTVVLDQGPALPPALIDVEPGRPVHVGVGEEVYEWDEAADEGVAPLELPELRRLPPLSVDAARAEITSPMGSLALLAGAARDLAAVLPGRSVATVEWATDDPAAPLTVAARTGEGLVLALGEEQFPMPADWPG